MQYRPQIIYTRLNDVFESSNNDIDSKNKNNQIKQKRNLENNIELINKKQKSQKNKYINKDLIKSWIKVVQSSKHI